MVRPDQTQLLKILTQGIAALGIERIMLHHVLHIVDRGVELVLVKVPPHVFAVELRKVVLVIFVPFRFFAMVPTLKIFGAPQIARSGAPCRVCYGTRSSPLPLPDLKSRWLSRKLNECFAVLFPART
jgi:hypothetical protein